MTTQAQAQWNAMRDESPSTPDRSVSETGIGPSAISHGSPQYYIPATQSSVPLRRMRTLKQGETFALFDDSGDISSQDVPHAGMFHRDTRHLSRLELFIDDYRPLLLSCDVRDDNSAMVVDLVNPDIYRSKILILSRETLHIKRSIFL